MRRSTRLFGAYVVSCMGSDSVISHFPVICTWAGDYRLGEICFWSVQEAVSYYRLPHNYILEDDWLRTPVPPSPHHSTQSAFF